MSTATPIAAEDDDGAILDEDESRDWYILMEGPVPSAGATPTLRGPGTARVTLRG